MSVYTCHNSSILFISVCLARAMYVLQKKLSSSDFGIGIRFWHSTENQENIPSSGYFQYHESCLNGFCSRNDHTIFFLKHIVVFSFIEYVLLSLPGYLQVEKIKTFCSNCYFLNL